MWKGARENHIPDLRRLIGTIEHRIPALAPASVRAARRLFRLAYGVEPPPGLLREVRAAPVATDADRLGLLRLLLGRTDRQRLPTPLSIRAGAGDIAFAAVEGVEVAYDRSDDAVGSFLRRGEPFEPHVARFVRQVVKPGMVVVDVGANVGVFTLMAARLVGPAGRVEAFEPHSENGRLLLLGVARNGLANVVLHPLALSTARGFACFSGHVGSNGGFIAFDEHSLLDPRCVIVPTARLDEAVTGRVDYLKLDVEGAEGLVIEGGLGLIARERPVLTTEFSPEMLGRVSKVTARDFLGRLVGLGYDVLRLDRTSHEAVPIPDIDGFIADYGADTRIEDLALVPRERGP